MRDQGLECDGCLSALTGPLVPDAQVTATVEHVVRLPLLGSVLGDGRRGGIPVEATHVEVVDRFRSAG